MVGSERLWQTALCPVANAISRIEDMLSVRLVTFHILMQPESSRRLLSMLSSRGDAIPERVSSSHAGKRRDGIIERSG